MIDNNDYRKRVLIEHASRPGTLFPFVAGATAILGGWALSMSGGIFFLGSALMLGSAGTYLTRIIKGDGTVEREILDEMQKEAVAENERSLDELEKALVQDGDDRTEKSLKDLRTLVKVFHEESKLNTEINTASALEISMKVDELFSGCVGTLEKTLELWKAAEKIQIDEARIPLIEKREQLVEDVVASIKQLGKILADIQDIGVKDSTVNLESIREELDLTLEIAKKVDQRMRKMDIPQIPE